MITVTKLERSTFRETHTHTHYEYDISMLCAGIVLKMPYSIDFSFITEVYYFFGEGMEVMACQDEKKITYILSPCMTHEEINIEKFAFVYVNIAACQEENKKSRKKTTCAVT